MKSGQLAGLLESGLDLPIKVLPRYNNKKKEGKPPKIPKPDLQVLNKSLNASPRARQARLSKGRLCHPGFF